MSALDLYALRRQLGGMVYDGGRRWIGPGPSHSRQDRSLSVRLTDDGRVLVYSFSGDTYGDCARHLGLDDMRSAATTEATLQTRKERGAAAQARQNVLLDFCEGVWGEAEPLVGSVAEAYLAKRGLSPPFTADLRFHLAAPLDYARGFTLPALIGLVRAADGDPKGLHVTALQADGSGKAGLANPRRMLGAVGGAALQLAPPKDGVLAVAEGRETALSFAALESLPCWSCLSATGLASFQVPREVRRLVIAADGDAAGRRAATALANRVSRRCDVEIMRAPTGLDWNDILMGKRK